MTHMLVSDDDEPIAVVDLDAIQARGTRLGYDLSVASDDATALDELCAAAVAEVGPQGFGYVAAAALRHVVENILQPLIEVAEAHGHPIRAGLTDAAEQAQRDLS